MTNITRPKIRKPTNSDIDTVCTEAVNGVSIVKNRQIEYYDMPASFDIETSSFLTASGEKQAIMYEWTLCLNGYIIIGRTWEEFLNTIDRISINLYLKEKRRLVIYIHNLAYEFQFIRKMFNWIKTFSLEPRKPIYVVADNGIEFRCSYLLSGYNLALLGEQLHTYPVKKKVGDLDYSKIRTPLTPLTRKEIGYCVNDVLVVVAYIQECIEKEGDITKIPMTKTGYVRRFCRNACLNEEGVPRKKSKKRKAYRELMNALTIEPEEYSMLKWAFQGGFTHANPMYSGDVLKNVGSFDFTSSYPAVMVSENGFPMSKGEKIEIGSLSDLEYNIKHYACLFEITFTNIYPLILYDNYISVSRCKFVSRPVVNNGRVVSADMITICITNEDYNIIKRFYTWDNCVVGTFYRYRRGYLPTDFVKAILSLYKDKTTLKGVSGREEEYLNKKEMLNSTYGMAVTDIVRPETIYKNDEWGINAPDIEESLKKYNKAPNRFLFYPWGVWVTAFARRNLFTGILEFKDQYVYSDTDSIKVLSYKDHSDYITKYNEAIRKKLLRACDHHHISYDMIEPLTIKGVKKCLGVWDFEGVYDKFKTLGAKRYMIEKDGEINITVSGLNKKVCVPYLLSYFKDPFKGFDDDLYVPPEYTGKNIHTYIDEERTGTVTDYKGTSYEYHELSCVHLAPGDYSLSLSKQYVEYINSLKEGF